MVLLFLFGCKRATFAFFVRCLTVEMPFVHALIAGVSQQFHMGRQRHTALLEQSEVMNPARACRHAQNSLIVTINHDLSFLGVAFLLAGIESTLFF